MPFIFLPFPTLSKRKRTIFHIFSHFYLEREKFLLPLHSQNDGAIAQLVEQRTENPCVPGSIPGGTTCKNSQNVLNNDLGVFLL